MNTLKRPSLCPLLPDFFCKVFRPAVKGLPTRITARNETGRVIEVFERLDRPFTHRAVRIPVSIPQNTVNRPLFVLPAFTRFKSAFCGLFLAFALLFPQTGFPQEIVPDSGTDHMGHTVKPFAADNSGKVTKKQSDGKPGNKRRSRVRIGNKVDSFFDVLRIHICLIFVKCGFWAGLITGTITGIYIYYPKIARGPK